MFELNKHPLPLIFVCPDCNCKLGQSTSLHFFGTHTMAECFCECCENTYLHTLPNGLTSIYSISLSLKTGKAKYDSAILENAEPWIESLNTKQSISARISINKYSEASEVMFLNCLDTSYERVFFKLIQANYFKKQNPSKGLILLVPASFEWLLPKSITEAWLVDISIDKLDRILESLDVFIKEECLRFRSVLFCSSSFFTEIRKIELNDYFKFPSFELTSFNTKPLRITFVVSENNLLLRSSFEIWLFKYFKSYSIKRQNVFIEKLVNAIQARYASPIQFAITGYGSVCDFKTKIKDLRKSTRSVSDDKELFLLYAESHLVIGIEGADMFIPKLLAAGSIELLIPNKANAFLELDLIKEEGSLAAFFNKKINAFSSINFIANEVLILLTRYSLPKK